MKNWIDLQTQVQRHLNRGLELGEITESDFALFLYSSNYYRVSGYGCCFYQPNSDRYAPGTTAEQLMTIYDLDRRIRNLILDGIGVVEPTVRSRVAYHVAKVIGGSHGYLDENLYLPIDQTAPIGNDRELSRWEAQQANRRIVLEEFTAIQQRPEIFIQHHLRKGNPVPFWAAIEVVSLGTFSRFLRALRDPDLLRPVTQSLDIEDERKFLQAIQNITYLRNIAAHHGRIWNRRFDGHVTLPGIALKVKRQYLSPVTPAAAITLLAGIVDQIEKSDSYSSAILDLVHSDKRFAEGYYHPVL